MSKGTLEPELPTSEASAARAQAALARAAALVRPGLDAAIRRIAPELQAPLRHHLGGGKYVRGGLAILSATAAGAPEAVGVVGGVAVELVHNYSLIHDDIIDGDRERRHRATVWAEFGVGRAIVTGDALSTLAIQVLLEDPAPARVRAAAALADATQRMITGQAQDMAFEGRGKVTPQECVEMEAGKTGALLSFAASVGAILADAPPATVAALGDFGSHLGLAFQAIDDMLGIWGEPSRTGKPVGGDLLSHKRSLPVVLALARAGHRYDELVTLLDSELSAQDVLRAAQLIEDTGARREVMAMADAELSQALAALQRVPLADGAREDLEAVARFVTERDR